MKPSFGVVTVGRSDYSIWLPILRRIKQDPGLDLRLMITGTHMAQEFGKTVEAIREDGFLVDDRIELSVFADTPEGIAHSMGRCTVGFSERFARYRPDWLLVVGDRFEMHAAALAALPYKIPVAHIHGGELTQGAMDDALRHSLTKLSHLHFVATETYARRVAQLGEEPWRITVSGAPSLENLKTLRLLTRQELGARLGFRIDEPPLLVTFHPVTLEYEQTDAQVGALLESLRGIGRPMIFTMPNTDTSYRTVARQIRAFAQEQPRAWFVENLGTQAYFSMMGIAAAMVGNSSSGIVEAPSLALPVVNIGTRQQGRVRAANVIDTGYAAGEIRAAIEQALRPEFRERLAGLENPYGGGSASELIVDKIKQTPVDDRLLKKQFVDLQPSAKPAGASRELAHA
jgi:UDP-N-acetylglucosamine 2-epimerase (non-hydrolysing)/GDP/UDP-N,N'-diacetylbacillosamine 2-epimerase (hydrolysing)